MKQKLKAINDIYYGAVEDLDADMISQMLKDGFEYLQPEILGLRTGTVVFTDDPLDTTECELLIKVGKNIYSFNYDYGEFPDDDFEEID